jgi:hypothetical protein
MFLSFCLGKFLELPLIYFYILLLFIYSVINKKILVSNLLLVTLLLLAFIVQLLASYISEGLQENPLSFLIHGFPLFITLAFGILFSNKLNIKQIDKANNFLSRLIYIDWFIWNALLLIPLELNILLYEGTFRFTSLIISTEAIINIIMLFKIWSNINKNANWIYYILPILIIFQTFQRAAILSLLIILFFSNIKKIYTILGVLLIVFITIFGRAAYMHHDTSEKQLSSIAHRVVLYSYSILSINDSFPYGVGSGNAAKAIQNVSHSDFQNMIEKTSFMSNQFKDLILRNVNMQKHTWGVKKKETSVHNTFLNIILDYGAFGLMCSLIVITPLFFIFTRRFYAMEVKLLYTLMPIYVFLTNYSILILLLVLSIRSYRKSNKIIRTQ